MADVCYERIGESSQIIVVKIGGSLIDVAENVLLELESADANVLIIPGGGVFADTVRAENLDDDASHWKAIASMNRYGRFLSTFGYEVVETLDFLESTTSKSITSKSFTSKSNPSKSFASKSATSKTTSSKSTNLKILLPEKILRQNDPLPHSWDVTSDSIALWVAATLDAPLLLIKSREGDLSDPELVDAYFTKLLSIIEKNGVKARVSVANGRNSHSVERELSKIISLNCNE